MRLLRNIIALVALATAALASPTLAPTAHADAADVTRLTAAGGPHWIAPGDSATISGTLLRAGIPYAGQPVDLLARVPTGNGFTVAASTTTSENGTVSFTVAPERRTVYRLRFAGNDETRRSLSHRVVVHLAWQTNLAIATGQGTATSVVIGELRGKGHRLRGRQILLETYQADAWTEVATKRTRFDGRVRFAVASPGDAGDYRLRFAGAGRYRPSTSATVTLD